jgi:hypothetical protein
MILRVMHGRLLRRLVLVSRSITRLKGAVIVQEQRSVPRLIDRHSKK